ncbi:unnamed protein product [Dovyalis caffra]|uniref:Glycine-rich protein n=1 Tax=Dovyalis caffra TaxID=77055 RepID=A0AAV1S131_9ROSI|nr:unnamed protein product [Dovyalis caffra]
MLLNQLVKIYIPNIVNDVVGVNEANNDQFRGVGIGGEIDTSEIGKRNGKKGSGIDGGRGGGIDGVKASGTSDTDDVRGSDKGNVKGVDRANERGGGRKSGKTSGNDGGKLEGVKFLKREAYVIEEDDGTDSEGAA